MRNLIKLWAAGVVCAGIVGCSLNGPPKEPARSPESSQPKVSIYETVRRSVVSIEIDGHVIATGTLVVRRYGSFVWTASHALPAEGVCLECGAVHELRISKRVESGQTYIGRIFAQVEVLKNDPVRDLAVLKVVTPFEITGAAFAYSGAELGDEIFHVGNAGGEVAEESVLFGHVAKINRMISIYDLPVDQADLSVMGGCSGGPVFNTDGEVVGILVAALSENKSFSYYIPLRYIVAWAKENGVYYAVHAPLW